MRSNPAQPDIDGMIRLPSRGVAIVLAIVALILVSSQLGWTAMAANGPSDPAGSSGRLCGAQSTGNARCLGWARPLAGARKPRPSPSPTPTSNCVPMPSNTYYGPADIRSAYNFASAATSAGAGLTVAIVDAYDDPNALSDVNCYRAQFGIAQFGAAGAPTFTKVNQTGGTTYPARNSGWIGEISLDVDMVSAACPRCSILLVEASSSYLTDLGAAENYAANVSGVVAVSNSWGAFEDPSETGWDQQYLNHPGKAIVAAGGDNGGPTPLWPSSSPYVTSVGGTTLVRATNSRGWSESVWSGTSSGCSGYESQPAWQAANTNITLLGLCTERATNDVAADADLATGVLGYMSYQQSFPWFRFGGTSVGTPLIASLYALAGNATIVTGGSYAYSHASSLNDVTAGQESSCLPPTSLCQAGSGWDGPTGLGTPNGTGGF